MNKIKSIVTLALFALGITAFTPNAQAESKLAVDPEWSDARTIAIDTRERIVVNTPNDVLPIAYSTNNWGEVTADQTKVFYFRDGEYVKKLVDTNENGYVEWQPTREEYGQYTFGQAWLNAGTAVTDTSATIYYGADYQFVYDDDKFIFARRHKDDTHGMTEGEDVTSYSLLYLSAYPPYSNVDRYEFATWKVYTYAERDIGWKTAVEAPELLANFSHPKAEYTTFEMPFTNVFISCDYQWKSNYTWTVEVEPGINNAWEIHEGETYQQGITTVAGSIVSLRGKVNPGKVTLAAGATNIWDFTNGGQPCFEDFSTIQDNGGTLQILFDETLENQYYAIAKNAAGASGKTFKITDGTDTVDCTESMSSLDWVYLGTKRFMISVNPMGILYLVVEEGTYVVSYDAQGGAWSDGTTVSNVTTYVTEGYQLPKNVPSLHCHTFLGWYTQRGGLGEAVTNDMPFTQLKDHSVYASWEPGIAFDQPMYNVLEGGSVKVYVYGGSPERDVQATLSYVKGSGAYSAAYVDGKKVPFPYALNWTKGEVGMKEILFQTRAGSRAEEDKFFTLQLSAGVGQRVVETENVCTVMIRDAQGGVAPTPYVRALAYPANAGTISGAGTLATARSYRTLNASPKKYATFAGWYKAKADNPDVIDFESPVEPYSPKNPRQIRVGYGTENEAGTYFAYFTDVLPIATVLEPQAFGPSGQRLPGVKGVRFAEAGVYGTFVGVKFTLPIDIEGEGIPTARGLPTGISLNLSRITGQYVISGMATRAGTYNATFTTSNAAGKSTVTYTFVVDDLPLEAVGTFYGTFLDDTAAEDYMACTGYGSVTISATSTGAISAKVLRRGMTARSFSTKGYEYVDDNTFRVLTSAGGEVLDATLTIDDDWYRLQLKGLLNEGSKGSTHYFSAWRNAFAKRDQYPEAQQVLETYRGTYAEKLYAWDEEDEAPEEVGTVQYRITTDGNISIAAKIAKTQEGGKTVPAKTMSGTITGAFRYDYSSEDGKIEEGVGCCDSALINGQYLWSSRVIFNPETRGVWGGARYIRPSVDKTAVEPVDQRQSVGAPLPEGEL